MDRVSLLIIGVFFTIMLAGLGFIAVQTREVVRISREIAEQHQTFLANQATILRDNDRMMHDHDAAARAHRAILQRLGH